MFDANSELHRCRNPRCKTWLKEPAQNKRDAFCCTGCEVGHYRVHCRVCDRPIVGKNSRRELCGRARCETEFRRHRARFFGVRYPDGRETAKPEKNLAKSTLKTGIKSDRRWRQIAGPALSASAFHCAIVGADEVLRRNAIANREYWNAAALIGPNDPPVNVLGGYKFPHAPKVEASVTVTDYSQAVPSDWQPCLAADWQTLPNLSISTFSRRSS